MKKKVAQTIELLKKFPLIKAGDLAKKLGVATTYAYVLRAQAKREMEKGSVESKPTSNQEVEELKAEIAKYHEWCLEWRRLNDNLEEELQRTQFMLMDAQAIIHYLESKVGV